MVSGCEWDGNEFTIFDFGLSDPRGDYADTGTNFGHFFDGSHITEAKAWSEPDADFRKSGFEKVVGFAFSCVDEKGLFFEVGGSGFFRLCPIVVW